MYVFFNFLPVRFSKARIQLLQSRCIKELQYPKIMAVFVHNIIHAELIELIEAECNCYNPTAQWGCNTVTQSKATGDTTDRVRAIARVRANFDFQDECIGRMVRATFDFQDELRMHQSLIVVFLLQTDSEYPKDAGIT